MDSDTCAPHFLSLWAINDRLDRSRLRQQLDEMKRLGLDGAVFHPRFYPNQPEYLSDAYLADVSDAILHAKSIGMEFWIYDENGWPSGTVGGKLLERYPGQAQQWADLVAVEPADSLGGFEHDGMKWFVGRRWGAGVDYLNPSVSRHFLEMTYERYRLGLSSTAFDHVTTFFSDEPEFGLGHAYAELSPHGAVPWTPQLPELYRARYGEELSDAFPLLFFPGAGHREARVRFWELLTDLFCESFITPIDRWCRQHGKRFTAHIKGEEHPLFQVPMVGSSHRILRHLGLPGIDALERDLSNDYFPRQLASVAQQFGDGRCMAECFGGAGWGASPEDVERYLLWLGNHGVTDFVLHLWQYRLNSHAIRDWPASFPAHVNWREFFPEALTRVRAQLASRLLHERRCAGHAESEVLRRLGSSVGNPSLRSTSDSAWPAGNASETASHAFDSPETLVISPHRGIMAEYEPRELALMNIHNAATYADTSAGRINREFLHLVQSLHDRGANPHFADERTFEEGDVAGNAFQISNRRYRRVIISPGCRFTGKGDELLHRLERAGIVTVGADEIAAPPPTPQPAAAPTAQEIVEPDWEIIWSLSNACVLESQDAGEGRWTATFDSELLPGIELWFCDTVREVTLNGRHCELAMQDDGCTVAQIPTEILPTSNTIGFRAEPGVTSPFIWLRGQFTVRSRTPFVPGPGGVLQTDGPFYLCTTGFQPVTFQVTQRCPEMVSSGYPFSRSPMTVETQIDAATLAAKSCIRLDGVVADAAKVLLNGQEIGVTFGPQWELAIPPVSSSGSLTLRLQLIPSTFNFFGPRHHVDGDPHVVSPDQFSGKKNFADRPDAPDPTRVKAWHFKPVRPPIRLILTSQ